jgi:hypothetical protein
LIKLKISSKQIGKTMRGTRIEKETYQTVYQRRKYAPVKKENAKKRRENFLALYPDWELRKTRLSDEELFIVNSYYGLEGQKLFNREIAKKLGITTQWLYVRRKKIEAKLLIE